MHNGVQAAVEFGLSTIGQIGVNVKDTERAVRFYQHALGMKLMFRAGQLAFFDCGGTRLMLSPPERPEFDHPSSILYFKVADIHAGYAVLRQRGVNFEAEPHVIARMTSYDLWMSFFRDSEGNLLALMAESPRLPAR